MSEQGFQDIGDRLTKALLTGDSALYRDLIALPITITPRGASAYVIEDEDCLQKDFTQYHLVLKTNAVTDIFRDLQEVTPAGPCRVVVRVITHIMAHANRVAEPFETRFFLKDLDGDWRITAIESSAAHIGWALGQPQSGFGWV